MIRLNDDSIYVGQIKQILHSFNLPMFPIYQENSRYLVGEHYLKDDDVFAYINIYDDKGEKIGEEEKFVEHYTFGEPLENLTTNLPISSNVYDSQTHVYLGNYLRFLRDYIGLDLMSLYNCCGYDSPRDFEAPYLFPRIDPETGKQAQSRFSSEDSKYTLIMVPVKRGRTYTIGIDYHGDIEMACMHYENNTMLDSDSLGNYIMLPNTFHKVRGPRFNHPFIYDKLSELKHDGDVLENTLKLFIKVPTSCKSSIVVLEGDYRNCSNDNLYMDSKSSGEINTYKQKLGDSPIIVDGVDPSTGEVLKTCPYMLNYDFVNKNQLLSLNLGQKVLLADRLVEYLSQQAIAPNDDVVDNIKRAQRTLLYNTNSYNIKQFGVWDNGMRKSIYNFIWNNGIINNYEDMLSYFDKDVETKIGGLLSKYSDLDPKSKTFTYGEIGGN